MQGNPDYGIREIFARGIRNTAQGIQIPTNQRNPESGIQDPVTKSGIQYLGFPHPGVEDSSGYSLVKGALLLNSAKAKDLSLVLHRRPRTK